MNKQADENKKYIASIIKYYRKKKNITQEKLSEILGINRSSVSRYEDGIIEVPASNLEIISDACDFNPIYYFHKKKNPYETLEKIAYNLGVEYNYEFIKSNKPNDDFFEDSIPEETYENLYHMEWLSKHTKDLKLMNKCMDLVINDLMIAVNKTNNLGRLLQYCEEFKKKIFTSQVTITKPDVPL